MNYYYRLDKNKNAIPCDVKEWAEYFESNDRIIANDIINQKRISTVFVGLNTNIFETMVFSLCSGFDEIYCKRYLTWKEAQEGHKQAIEWANIM